MIRHKPLGSGHPYSVDTEQRHPIDPVAGQPVTLGVRSSEGVGAVALEYSINGGQARVAQLSPATRTSRGQSVDGGHLASAQARLARAARAFLRAALILAGFAGSAVALPTAFSFTEDA